MEAMILLAVALLLAWRLAPRADVELQAERLEPVVYGVAIALVGFLLTHTVIVVGEILEMHWAGLGLVTIAGINLALLVLVAAIFLEHEVPLARPEALGAFGLIILLGAITRSTPGVAATLFLLVLGFDRRARGLMTMAITFFLFFGAAYYYDLRLTLLQKSGILVLSGVVCLAAWAVLRGTRSHASASA